MGPTSIPILSRRQARRHFHRIGNNGASRILIVDLDGNNRRTLFEERNLEAPDHVAWSPDGARLVVNTMTWKMGDDGNKYISDPYEAKMRLIVLNADGKGLREIPLPRIGWLGQPQWL